MDERPSGWYDDPNDDALLRYWDGVIWTEHVANKRPVEPAQPVRSPAQDAGRHDAGDGGRGLQADRERKWPPFRPGPAGSAPAAAGGAGDLPPAGWWRRAGAFVVDWFLVAIVCLPFTYAQADQVSAQLPQWYESVRRAAESGQSMPEVPPDLMSAVVFVNVVHVLVYIVAEVLLLLRFGATPGRWLTGIRVRARGGRGGVSLDRAVRRTAIKNLANLLGGLPVVSFFATVFQVVDYLWPLRDRGRQALHDKAGDTQVVRAPRSGTRSPSDAGGGPRPWSSGPGP